MATRLNGEFKQHFQDFIEAAPGETTLQTTQDLHQHAEFAELVKAINAMANDILNFLEADHSGIQISGCWANFGAPGANHITHHLVNNYFSGVYYVNAPLPGATPSRSMTRGCFLNRSHRDSTNLTPTIPRLTP